MLHLIKTGRTKRRDWYCKCVVCKKMKPTYHFQAKDNEKEPCDYCGNNRYLYDTHNVVKEFLKVSKVCIGCCNGIAKHVHKLYGLCYGKDSDIAIQLALLHFMNSELSSLTNKDRYCKYLGHSSKHQDITRKLPKQGNAYDITRQFVQ